MHGWARHSGIFGASGFDLVPVLYNWVEQGLKKRVRQSIFIVWLDEHRPPSLCVPVRVILTYGHNLQA